ncbi:hypothetical protein F0L74_26425 [Chitinophaga agrisoli]|uniref:Calcineurin-like phosphoesterase domain-containing protein n=1 Tax=Chitinophaga agrisoli TaxID=2607653 RepID=A0A5B2VKV8_9BACT|nr:metallophosphoesterase [Chitinophaga agrisoli]KAA2239731.1 hypothetical protein F0L74_26425 [Chitinophaga agrisoli]
MNQKFKISLRAPGTKSGRGHFSFRIKETLSVEPSTYVMPDRVVVVADVAGRFRSLRRLLLKEKVIDKYYRWTFGNGHLVILGNCFDKDEQSVECLWLIYSLEERAMRKGGHVHFLLGDYELKGLEGEWRFRQPRYAKVPWKSSIPYAVLYDGNNELWRWLQTKNVAERIGDVLFTYGGVARLSDGPGGNVECINEIARSQYIRKSGIGMNSMSKHLSELGNLVDPTGEISFSGPSKREVEKLLASFGVNTMITSHTAIKTVLSIFDGRVINVNAGDSVDITEWILIRNGIFFHVRMEGTRRRIR